MKITKTWARATLSAVDATIHKYKNMNGAACQLCITAKEVTPNKEDCACPACPWVVFRGHSCQSIKNTLHTKWGEWYFQTLTIKQCLSRLYGWRKRLQNIIANSSQKKIGKRRTACQR